MRLSNICPVTYTYLEAFLDQNCVHQGPVSGYNWKTSTLTPMESGKIWRWKCADKADHFGNIEDPGILCTSNIDFPFSLQPTIYTLSIQSDQGTRDPPATSSRDIVLFLTYTIAKHEVKSSNDWFENKCNTKSGLNDGPDH